MWFIKDYILYSFSQVNQLLVSQYTDPLRQNKLNIALFFYFEPNEFDGAASAAIYDEIEVDWKIDVVCFASACAHPKF